MLRFTNLKSDQAKRYFTRADYYTSGSQETIGTWGGEIAKRLGLVGTLDQKTFDALIDNINPITGESLTPRTRADRRVAFDITFSCPKSVSLLLLVGGDERIRVAHQRASWDTMTEMEEYAAVRVRAHGQNTEKLTKNILYASFDHLTARPVGGIPDPHLHRHCVVINATFDQDSGEFRALENVFMKTNADYFQATYFARLAANLRELGYSLEKKGLAFEIRGVPQAMLDEFSQRDKVIRAERKKRGDISDKEADKLAALTREKKSGALTMTELDGIWLNRTTPELQQTLEKVIGESYERTGNRRLISEERAAVVPGELEQKALDYALRHVLARKSVVAELDVYKAALEYAVVDNINTRKLRELLHSHPGLIRSEEKGWLMVTTPQVLAEEQFIVDFARKSRGTMQPLALGHPTDPGLSLEQQRACDRILSSTDQVTGVSGRAGVGKTRMLISMVEAIEANGHRVMVYAPTSAASRGVLREAGFEKADTVSTLLISPKAQEEARGSVWLIDEAGLMSVPMAKQVFQLAAQLDARIILSGDSRQHASVERGEALRLLENRGAVEMASLSSVQRQSGFYKQAVQLLSQGQTDKAFAILDQKMNSIIEIEDETRHSVLAKDYLEVVWQSKTALIVAPTHKEIGKVTDAIREALKEDGGLKREREAFALDRIDLTDAQKELSHHYSEGWKVQFMRPARGFRTGERAEVVQVLPDCLVVRNDKGEEKLLDIASLADRFQVYEPEELPVAVGERLRITQNTKWAGHELRNGTLHTVVGFDKDGGIKLDNGLTLPPDFGHIAHGYAVTSHIGQGRSVDYMFVAESADSLAGASLQQFYVSITRGKYGVKVYTDDKEMLLEAVSQSRERLSAMDFVYPLPQPELVSGEKPEVRPEHQGQPERSARRFGNSRKSGDLLNEHLLKQKHDHEMELTR